jgi:hypothetical protein
LPVVTVSLTTFPPLDDDEVVSFDATVVVDDVSLDEVEGGAGLVVVLAVVDDDGVAVEPELL